MSVLRDALRDLPDTAFFDVLESEAAYLVVLDVPGVPEDRLDVAVEDGCITIEARRKKELPQEFDYVAENRPLFHDVELPMPADAVASEADLTVDRGVLELRLPKRADESETSIDVVEATGGTDDGSAAGTNGEAIAGSDAEIAGGAESDETTRIDVDGTGEDDAFDVDGTGEDDAFDPDESS